MVKTIICSVGTSAARKLGVKPNELLNWVNEQNSMEDAVESLFSTFRDLVPEGENLKYPLSAEIHSLVRIGITNEDQIVLLSSNTNDGYCCALAVKKYLEYYWKGISVLVERIPGLQVYDAELFRKTGVVEFVKFILKQVEKYDASNIILNPTGGYKALVPYTVLLGMLKGIKCDYIFEQSTTLLELPPLPLEFKRGQFEAYKPLFEEIDRESSISQEKWENSVDYLERKWFDSLVEISSEGVTLSAIGCLFWEEIRKPSALVPFLSQKAIADCFENLALLDQCDPFRFLSRVAGSKDLFDKAEHLNMGNGLRWLKPGNTTDRYLVSIEDWRLLVWRAIREDQEGSKYPNKIKIADPEADRRSYSPFIRMEFVN